MWTNGKNLKHRIFSLDQDEVLIEGDEAIKTFIIEYYNDLFSSPEVNHITMLELHRDFIPEVSDAEHDILTAPFIEKEACDVVFQMKRKKKQSARDQRVPD